MHCGKPLKDETREYCCDCERRIVPDRDGRDGQRTRTGRAPAITQGRGLWLHQEPVSGALYRFKYKNKRHWGKIFAAEMAARYEEQMERWEIQEIIPIPLHVSRRRKRGFNQAEILARELSAFTGIPCRTDVLFRIRKTAPQKTLDGGERADNLKGAFGVSSKWQPCGNILLIDDIYTTGATVERAAKILKIAGARNIYFLTVSIGQGI